MARYIGNKCKLCRREGMKLFLKGQRCFTDKCALSRRDYPPGVHAQKRSKVTDYGVRLREKQKLKRIYGVLERQFRLYFKEAERLKGNTGENLLMLLERRLDNVVLASGFALSRNHARQLINHGHFTINDKRVDIASFQVRPGDVLKPSNKEKTKKIVGDAVEVNKSQPVPAWLSVSGDAMEAKVNGIPRREDVPHPIQEQLIIELCSK
ncbi:MAG: 30S ribosomal protein S4 [Planctomycetes bacterium]|nr:30S ribosomal protein S4 [Planctomycetota bacterium]MCB9905675.1 30S ribosomal protein S4 [Planctomycetota bacterium]